MPQITVTVSKEEIEQAVTDFVLEKIRPTYNEDFTEPKLSFVNRVGDIGYFEGVFTTAIADKEASE